MSRAFDCFGLVCVAVGGVGGAEWAGPGLGVSVRGEESILGLKVEAVQGIQVSLEWTETSGVSGNAGTALEFRSPLLWKAPPLEMRRESRKFFPDHAGKGSFLSS